MMKLEKMNHLLVIIITIVSQGCLLSACDSKNEAETDYNLGNKYASQGKLEDAITAYQQAIQIAPNLAPAHYNPACIYLLKNEQAQAIEWLQKVIVLDAGWIDKSKTDSDFDNIRQSPEFQQLIGSE